MAFHFLIFNLERNQRELFSPGQLQWLFPPMEVIKLQHPTKSSLWCSDDGLISEKSKAELYLGTMESKHTTRFTRKKVCKKINRFVYILTDLGIGSLVIIIYIGHYFLPIAYVIFILTQCLVPVILPVYQDCKYFACTFGLFKCLFIALNFII